MDIDLRQPRAREQQGLVVGDGVSIQTLGGGRAAG